MTHLTLAYLGSALPLLWDGMLTTFELTAVSLAGGLFLGILLAILRLSRVRAVALAAAGYVNLMRALPLLLLIFWFYFLVPLFVGRSVGGFTSALIGFVLFEAAYFSEIIRSGIQSVRRGQIMAGLGIGTDVRADDARDRAAAGAAQHAADAADREHQPVQGHGARLRGGRARFLTTASVIGTRDNTLVPMYCLAALVYFLLCFAASMSVGRLQRRYAI